MSSSGKTSVLENKSKNYINFSMINLAIVLIIIYFMLTHLTSCAYGIHILTQGDVLLSMVSTPLPSGSEFPVTHCKKRLTIFPSPAGMSLSKFPWTWKIKLFSPRESLVNGVTSRLGMGKWQTFFYSAILLFRILLINIICKENLCKVVQHYQALLRKC